MGENKLNTKTSKKSNAQPKLKARFETKVIQDLKKEYEEKIKKARDKENAKIEKFHKDFSMMILENSLNNENFKRNNSGCAVGCTGFVDNGSICTSGQT